MKMYRVDGAEVHSIADLYEQLNRELMAEQDWRLGSTLDGLNDVLYRIESEIRAGEPAALVWTDHLSREGVDRDLVVQVKEVTVQALLGRLIDSHNYFFPTLRR
jgi:RNAse (barnase) inhibitor barstar